MDTYPAADVMMEDILHQLPGKSLSQIRRAAHAVGLRRPRSALCTAVHGRGAKNVWTPDEDALVLRMWKARATAAEIRRELPHRTELVMGSGEQRNRKPT